VDVAADLGLRRQDLHLFGDIIAKLKTTVPADLPGKLILVSAMTPTEAGDDDDSAGDDDDSASEWTPDAASEVDDDGDGWMVCEGDCDDADASILPGIDEACDGLDSNCNGLIPSDEVDEDEDGQWGCEGDCQGALP
jgi:hypothetical protein